MVEIILQILTNIEHSKIVITTQSNSAANLIVQRLIRFDQVDETNLLRLIAYNYANRLNVLPKDIEKYSSTIDDLLPKTESNYYSRLEETRKFRVVVGTSTTIGQLLESKSLRNNFTHAIIDEAGQSTELGVLVPMALVGSKGQTIMAGDPMQMPPLVMNLHANTRGLSTSMLSRLLDCYEKVENAVSAISFTLVKSKIYFSFQLLVSLLNISPRPMKIIDSMIHV